VWPFKNFYHIYTDNSKIGHRVSAALCHKPGTSAIRLPGATSIFNAELHAILLALHVVRRSKEKHFLLLSDSYSSLIALGGSHLDQDTNNKYSKTYSNLTNSGKTVILFWIPGHVEIPWNERADRVAKAALSLPISPVKVSVTDFLHAPNYLCVENAKIYGIAVMVTSFTPLIPRWVYQTEWFTQSKRCRHYQQATDWSHACYTRTSSWRWRRTSLYDLLYFTNCEPHSHRMSTV